MWLPLETSRIAMDQLNKTWHNYPNHAKLILNRQNVMEDPGSYHSCDTFPLLDNRLRGIGPHSSTI